VADAATYELDLGSPGTRAPEAPDFAAIHLLDVTLPFSEQVEDRIRAEVERSLALLDLTS
jgi:hypothetical protein